MYQFQYHRPKNLAEALDLLAQDGDAKLLAGGQTLLPTLRQRLAAPSALVDLAGISELTGISTKGELLSIGAMTRYIEIIESPLVQATLPSLARAVALVGDPLVRNRGTIGGSLANNDPTADLTAAALAMHATFVTDRRSISADEFFVDLFETALEQGEILVRIEFPLPDRAAYVKFRNPASRYALVGVFVAEVHGDIRVAVTGAKAKVFREHAFEAALQTEFSAKAVKGLDVGTTGLIDDLHASAEYRANLISVLTRRAISAAMIGSHRGA
ncbi:xanthine dehydrogenase family protein subunit M [Bradyrhizobium canariense]|uniref:FAD binding domain-containing protein n=1 Tax=Bradyrhizobium canariense TaxID=255045 RepID=UPI001C67D793|nr:xanthine dehydrogenase family protein subunit M [Bradyrhizobium canariense]MBW5435736.1 xanthine dehydrogenase family protein subunit M [Bradyrhizobium canariense]